jgi:hypothetical protein
MTRDTRTMAGVWIKRAITATECSSTNLLMHRVRRRKSYGLR